MTWSHLRQYRSATGFGLGMVLLVVGLAALVTHWWTPRPQSTGITVKIAEPGVTAYDKELKPDPVRLTFSQSVAPLAAVGKTVGEGIRLTPPMAGTWRWDDDRTLVFRPRDDWPAATAYTVETGPDLFAEHAPLPTDTFHFATPLFRAEITGFSFYQDPKDADRKKVVGTIRFSHPVQQEDLDGRIAMELTDEETSRRGAIHLPFTLRTDQHLREVYLHSENITLAAKDRFAHLQVDDRLRTALGGARLSATVGHTAAILGSETFLRVETITTQIVRNAEDDPEQILSIRFRGSVIPDDLQRHLALAALPERTAQEESDLPSDVADVETALPDHAAAIPWESVSDVTPEILATATAVPCTALPTIEPSTVLFSCRYRQPPGTTLHVQVEKGLMAFGGYRLGETYAELVTAPDFPTELHFTPAGALLALHGARKLSLQSRGIHRAQLEFARVLPDDIHDLAVESVGDFSALKLPGSLDEENIAEIFTESLQLGTTDLARAHYSVIDMGRYLASRRGLFLMTARGWAPAEEGDPKDDESSPDAMDRRLVLVTDIGLLHKQFANNAHVVFAYSLSQGRPLPGVQVSIVAKNGLQIHTITSGQDGAATFPPLGELRRERTPVVIIASHDEDVAFLPFRKAERELNYSNFDVEGEQLFGEQQLTAYLFSDRGIYRPGEALQAGMIVKASEWQPLENIPIEIVVKDPRGLTVQREKFSLPPSGYMDMAYQTDTAGLTGTYTINAYLVRSERELATDDEEETRKYLGSTAVKVEEFLPDQMKMTTKFSKALPRGWVHPDALQGEVALMNLYGTPASERQVAATLTLRPAYPALAGYAAYTFFNPLKFENLQSEDLAPQQTDAEGRTTFDFALDRFARATYLLEFLARGFSAEGGRSVESSTAVLVSPLDTLVGYHADATLSLLPRQSTHTVHIIAVDHDLQQKDQEGIRAELIRQRYISTLIEQADGTLKYQSLLKEEVVSEETVAWSADGWNYPVPTTEGGTFVLRLYDALHTKVAQIPFSVAGATNVTRALDRSAELTLALDQPTYAPGGSITLQIEAPYVGTGLITIERDRIYAQKWFTTDTPTSVQTIDIPPGLEGGAYLNVALIRDGESKEIYVSPLSYGVVPFAIAHTEREEPLTLEVPELVRPGDDLVIRYRTAQPAQIVLWAVDEGILQFAGYPTPDPLAHFFQKRALEVRTFQTLDLIMPEYALYQQSAAPGGDQSYKFLGNNLNPFRRRTEPPVAFWSGLVSAGPDGGEYRITVPNSFDGRMRVMAVAVNDAHIGVAEGATTVRGAFVLTPTLPLFSAPGDRFQMSTVVANQVEGSGASARVTVAVSPTEGLHVDGEPTQTVTIPEGEERAVQFTCVTGDHLGEQRIELSATHDTATRTASTSLSVRPAAAYQSTVLTGFTDRDQVTVTPPRQLYPDLRTMEVTAAPVPHGIGRGLAHYLSEYPYGCTEQLVSRGVAALAALQHPEFRVDAADLNANVARLLSLLRSRQRGNGAFRYWPDAGSGRQSEETLMDDPLTLFTTLYATHLLLELPAEFAEGTRDMQQRALAFIGRFLEEPIEEMVNAHLYAYATYLRTRSGEVTSNYLANVMQYLQEHDDEAWQQSLTGTLIAATHQLLKQSKPAQHYRKAYTWKTLEETDEDDETDFFLSPASQDALYMYLLARHFPTNARQLSAEELHQLIRPLEQQRYHTVSAAYALLALSALAHTTGGAPTGQGGASDETLPMILEAAHADDTWFPLASPMTGAVTSALFDDTAVTLRIRSGGTQPIFYQIIQRGFDRSVAKTPRHTGLEITRQLTNAAHEPVADVAVGDAVFVHLRVRAVDRHITGPVTVVDLLPAGLEIHDMDAVRQGHSALAMQHRWTPEYIDIREDRAIFYGTVTRDAAEFVYETRAVNPGTFQVPPTFGEAMYQPDVQSRGVTETLTISPAAATPTPASPAEQKP
ncbi:MAG: alpha-2-macroglobulin [Deltaproteobacteria bacterium]|nr:alpha-2-macroglobulin [Deltaproteobacteria bacterium]